MYCDFVATLLLTKQYFLIFYCPFYCFVMGHFYIIMTSNMKKNLPSGKRQIKKKSSIYHID